MGTIIAPIRHLEQCPACGKATVWCRLLSELLLLVIEVIVGIKMPHVLALETACDAKIITSFVFHLRLRGVKELAQCFTSINKLPELGFEPRTIPAASVPPFQAGRAGLVGVLDWGRWKGAGQGTGGNRIRLPSIPGREKVGG